MNIKSEKSFFDLEKNNEHKNFDDDKSNANNKSNANDESNASAKSSANANNFFDDMNENENQIDSAKKSQKKERDDENCSRRADEI